MKQNTFYSIVTITLVLILGCNEQKFRADNKTRPQPVPANHVIKVLGVDEQADGGTKSIQSIDTVDLIIQAADDRKLSEIHQTIYRPVDLYFVLDSTGSMTEEISTIKSGISKIVDELRTKNIELQAGIVGYVDSFASVTARTLQLTADYNMFKSFLTGLKPQGNQDYPEASMYAARKAIDLLKSGAGRENALKSILLIGDVVGHNGSTAENTTEVRDCSVSQLTAAINDYASSLGDKTEFRFFYDVPDAAFADPSTDIGASEVCGGFNAKTQMEAVIDGIMPSKPKADRGGPLLDAQGRLNWPLTESGLVKNLADLLQSEVASDVPGTCLAKSATLFEGDNQLYTWKPTSLKDVYESKEKGNEIEMANVIGNKRTQGNQNLELKVERCCVTEEQISKSNFESCEFTFTQTIKYEIVNVSP